jgi:hypothetical protein
MDQQKTNSKPVPLDFQTLSQIFVSRRFEAS